MYPSKMKLCGLLVLALLMQACTKPDRSTEHEGSATSFFVDSLKGTVTQGPVDPKSVWKVPTHVVIGLQACIRERTTRRELPSQNFSVWIPEAKKKIPVRSNQGGCFYWTETMSYNHFAGQSGWVTVEREIVGEGSNNGRYPVSIAINPWAADGGRDDKAAVVYLRDGDDGFVPNIIYDPGKALNALAGVLQEPAQLFVQKVSIKAIPEGEDESTVAMLVELEMEPKVRVKTSTGRYHYEDIEDGDFDVFFQVLGSDPVSGMDKKVPLLAGEGEEIGSVGRARAGWLKAEFKLMQPRRLVQGNLELVMKIRPRAGGRYKNILPFNGLYRFGAGTQVTEHSGTLANMCHDRDPRCSYDAVMAKIRAERGTVQRRLEDEKYLIPNGNYIFSFLKFRFTSILPGETATQRTVVYSASTCITRKSTGEAVANMPMIIRYKKSTDEGADVEKEVIHRTSDESGCLTWTGQAFHKYYKPEEYFEKNITIERVKNCDLSDNPDTCKKEKPFTRDLKFFLNPWDDKFTFGWDYREQEEAFFDSIRSRQKIESRFFLDGFGYHTVRFLYNIDSFMDLEVKKTVLLDIQPAVLRYSGIINARKMTEQLRDGIYLMKVAIQKNYLDPRDNAGWLLKSTPQLRPQLEHVGGNPLVAKNFVTTNMALVRMVDGHIIYPIELTMRDLRLMRIRANFLIELQTVDERLIQAYHAFRDGVTSHTGLEAKIREFEKSLAEDDTLEDVRQRIKGVVPEYLKDITAQRTANAARTDQSVIKEELKAKVIETQSMISTLTQQLGKILNQNGGHVGFYLNGSSGDGKVEESDQEYVLLKNSLIVNNFSIDKNLIQDLSTVLKLNDFSQVDLPKKDEIDLNIFVEENSGVQPRTFVGPVIFLSNAYSDSVRATDNLDEACRYADKKDANGNPRVGNQGAKLVNEARDLIVGYNILEERERISYGVLEDQLHDGTAPDEFKMFMRRAAPNMEGKRLNNAFSYENFFGGSQNAGYQYNPNFGSLSHLCGKSVDDLMEIERELEDEHRDRLIASSLKYNFIKSFPFEIDFVSLTGKPLVKVADGCKADVGNCLVETTESTLPASKLGPWINEKLSQSLSQYNFANDQIWKWLAGEDSGSEKREWTPAELQKLFFENSLDHRPALCNMLANRFYDNVKAMGQLADFRLRNLRSTILMKCNLADGIIHDQKLHVGKTGSYTALGGMNLNINVGESFSVGYSYSWSSGLELTDFIGGYSGFMKGTRPSGSSAGNASGLLGNVVKPLSLKVGTSVSASDGTSISESTYLVAQVAKFQLDLLAYEKCAIVRLSDPSIRRLHEINLSFREEPILRELGRAMMVCEGATGESNPPKQVKESYFYFTQHFTEGDMLDQAELYNHPWMLALRGMRDYTVFVEQVRKQEDVGLSSLWNKTVGWDEGRPQAWALAHLYQIYGHVLPSFPGFYTVLEGDEEILFPMEQLTTGNAAWDKDPCGEILHQEKGKAADPKTCLPTVGGNK